MFNIFKFLTPKEEINSSRLSYRKVKSMYFNKEYEEYPQIIRTDRNDCNLNCDTYVFSGKYVSTNKVRTKRRISIYLDEKADVKFAIKELGYEDPILYEYEDPGRPSNAQLSYLESLTKHNVPHNLSCIDASYLIDRYVERDHIPNPELFDFATEKRFFISYYAGKKMLYNVIFSNLELRDQIAFYIFCIYRDKQRNCTGNLNRCRYKREFYDFADMMLENKKFTKSMLDNYYGEKLRFFGTKHFDDGNYIEGGSRRTMAYKTALEYLSRLRLVGINK